MHTPEQASVLWCPMARVAQVGNTDTQAAYNRILTKQHRPARMVKVRDPEDFELGQDGADEEVVLVLDMQNSVSRAAMCIADKCAMWRWEHTTASVPVVKESGGQKYTNYEQRVVRTNGYCGLAGSPAAL